MSEIEEKIKETYNTISLDFDKTRVMIWQCVKDFESLIKKKDALILDAGCGNGKNMLYYKSLNYNNLEGCDFSESFVELCKLKQLNVIYANILNTPYKSNYFDNIISIAVLHHLSTEENRVKALIELYRVLKEGGSMLITVASYEFPFYKKTKITDQNAMIPWLNAKAELMGTRFYYFFKKYELTRLCLLAGIKETNIREFYEHENWCVIIHK